MFFVFHLNEWKFFDLKWAHIFLSDLFSSLFFLFFLLSIRGISKFRSGKYYYFETHETVAVLFIYSQVSYILCIQWKQRKKTTLNSQFRIKSTRIIFEFWNKVFKGNQQGVQIICVYVINAMNSSFELQTSSLSNSNRDVCFIDHGIGWMCVWFFFRSFKTHAQCTYHCEIR